MHFFTRTHCSTSHTILCKSAFMPATQTISSTCTCKSGHTFVCTQHANISSLAHGFGGRFGLGGTHASHSWTLALTRGIWGVRTEKWKKAKYREKKTITLYFFLKDHGYHRPLRRCTIWARKWVRDQNLAFYPPCFTKSVVTQGERAFLHALVFSNWNYACCCVSQSSSSSSSHWNELNLSLKNAFSHRPLKVKRPNLFCYTFPIILATTFALLSMPSGDYVWDLRCICTIVGYIIFPYCCDYCVWDVMEESDVKTKIACDNLSGCTIQHDQTHLLMPPEMVVLSCVYHNILGISFFAWVHTDGPQYVHVWIVYRYVWMHLNKCLKLWSWALLPPQLLAFNTKEN